MRFTSALVAASVAVVASAQDTSSTLSLPPAQQSSLDCIEECDVTDVGCIAKCNPVPNPNDDQVEATHNCISDCDQGDGTAAQTEKYAQCQAACVKQHYYDSSMGTPEATGGNGGGAGGSDDAASTSADAGAPSSAADTATVTSGTATVSVTETTAVPTGSEASQSGSETATGSETASGTEDGAEATETGEGDNGAAGIFASTAAVFGAVAAFFAL